MFAPKVSKPRTKAAENPTSKLVAQRSAFIGHRLGHDPVEQALLFQRTIGNQATMRLIAPQVSRSVRNGPDGDPKLEVATENTTDFSKIPVSAADRADQAQASSLPVALPMPGFIIQPKLAIGRVDDPLEYEADRVADQVMHMPTPEPSLISAQTQVSRNSGACKENQTQTLQTELEGIQNKPTGASVAPGREVPNIVHEVLRSQGQPLDTTARAFLEPRFGRDFSSVRVHADDRAAASARLIGSHAYTVGRDVAFASGRYSPTTSIGRKLLAHELTHVIQQNPTQMPGLTPSTIQREPDTKRDDQADAAKDKAKAEFMGAREVQSLAKDCPEAFDEEVINWLYPKGDEFLKSRAYGSDNTAIFLSNMKTWKTPSKWGEGDYDIFYAKIRSDTKDPVKDADDAPKNHIKLLARFQSLPVNGPDKEFLITGDFIDWLDGHPIVRKSWQGLVHVVIRGGGFLSLNECKAVHIKDLASSAPPSPAPVAPPGRSKPG